MKVKGEHEIYCCGAKVQISERGIKLLTQPTVEYCPLHEALYGTKKIDAEAVLKTIEKKISGYGFCCENRLLNAEPVVAYGASEMMQVWLEKSLIDCAVIVCEGAGTVITSNGELVQAIGAKLTGIVRTSPIKSTIEHIETLGGKVLDVKSARIDQVEGVKQAFKTGFKRIAVTVAGFQAETISKIRRFEEKAKTDVLVFSVCNTCVDDSAVSHIAKADIACASASKILREKIATKALMQLGVTIPVYVLTDKGKRFVLAYLSEFSEKLVVFKTSKLPYNIEGKGPKFKPSDFNQ
jgi:putative methanogenesis marker protein 8